MALVTIHAHKKDYDAGVDLLSQGIKGWIGVGGGSSTVPT
jgi:hypothetical protein